MKNDIAQLVITGLGIAGAICVIGICACGLYGMGSLAWGLWGRHLVPSRPRRVGATSPHLVDAVAEGWLDEWDFPSREPLAANASDQTGEMELPRIGMAA